MNPLETLFKFHPKNWGKDYVQGWYCIGNPTHRYRRRVLEFLCRMVSGHEISKTEWGYSGGALVDCHCRWCDKVIPIPREEARFRCADFNDWGRHLFK